MSIQDEINRINENIASTYSALSDMGATMPEAQNSANMASTVRTVPQNGGGGAAAEEIFYVNGIFNMQTMTFLTDITYGEILAAVQSGMYIVAKAQAYMGEYNTDVIFLPISDCGLVSGVATFEGMMQINGSSLGLPSGLILLAIAVEICLSGDVITRIKSVSTTTIKE